MPHARCTKCHYSPLVPLNEEFAPAAPGEAVAHHHCAACHDLSPTHAGENPAAHLSSASLFPFCDQLGLPFAQLPHAL